MFKNISKLINSHPVGRLFNLAGQDVAWKKVRELKPGMKVAIAENKNVDWDEIVSVRKLGAERVWDIEVEGTHNFVAGHYVNTSANQALTPEEEALVFEFLKIDSLDDLELESLISRFLDQKFKNSKHQDQEHLSSIFKDIRNGDIQFGGIVAIVVFGRLHHCRYSACRRR